MTAVKNRWGIAASAVGIHISIGSIYAYSVWVLPLSALLGWQKSDIAIAFSIAILLLGFSAAFIGPRIEAMGPRKSGCIAALLYATGFWGSALAIHLASLPLFIFFFGVLGGIGLGIGYIAPVPTLVKWFPNHRGLATGIAIMGFGFSSMIFGPLIAQLCTFIGPVMAFIVLGCVFFLLMFLSSLYLAPPPAGWASKKQLQAKQGGAAVERDLSDMLARDAIRTTRFRYIWILVFINITCGIGLISVTSPMAQQVAGLTAIQAASLVGIVGLFNGLGRIAWSSFSDYFGRPRTYILFFVIQTIAYYLMSSTTSGLFFQILLVLVMTCYGGCFATLPALLSDMFGVRQLGTIHGYILTSWGVAGLIGPALVGYTLEATGTYTLALTIFAAMFVAALIISVLLAREIARVRTEQVV